ncbi:MAG: M23 family metallopeptidase [Thermodesulfobacteriota bacterium]
MRGLVWVAMFVAEIFVAFLSAAGGNAGAGSCEEWDLLQRQIRDQAIPRLEARAGIAALHERLLKEYPSGASQQGFIFPVRGASIRDIGGRDGRGFVASGYDFYEGNRHGGHPALDIFILDRNQDGLRDNNGEPVEILAFAGGVVVGANGEWDETSDIRGGKSVWVFSPSLRRYCYYAHLKEVMVKPGDVVSPGAVLGLLGRTGKNAVKKRSPTHLHFMCLSFDGGRMTPHNPYEELRSVGIPK